MTRLINYTTPVQYELMLGRQATEAIAACPVAYLPIGCLERHGDHLPMGLDTIKAHGICCLAAQEIGGVVFPAHFYSGVHGMSPREIAKYTGEWGNIYTDGTAKAHLIDIISQIATTGVKVLVLYTGHYPQCQVDMAREIGEDFAKHPSISVVPFYEGMVVEGDHAGISETSFMLYLDKRRVDMTRISEVNYEDHFWNESNSPEKASAAKGEKDLGLVIAYLRREIDAALEECK